MNMINIICKYQEWLTDNLTIKLISNNKKEQVYCNDFSLYREKKDKDYRLCATEFLRNYMTMGLV